MMKKEFVYGFYAVRSFLIKSSDNVLQLYFQEGRDGNRLEELLELAKKKHIVCKCVAKSALDKLVMGKNHQGILAHIKKFVEKEEKDLFSLIDGLEKVPFLLILEGLQDPHNLGACLRSANAAGVDAVVVTQHRSVGLTPAVRKVAAGSAEVTPLFTVVNLANTLRQLKKYGIWIYGLDGGTTRSLYTTDLRGPLALVFGAEGKGLRRLSKDLCDDLLAIPMKGSVESLNISVAAGISLFEVVRQQSK